jgi:hypothetical protein
MAAYNPHNFDLGQFMNDLFQQPDLTNQLQFPIYSQSTSKMQRSVILMP